MTIKQRYLHGQDAKSAMNLTRCLRCQMGGQRNKAVAAKLKAEGVKPGVPDVLMPSPRGGYVGLAIEFKFDDNNCGKEQRDRITRMQKDGWLCVVVWDWEAAARTINGYLDMPRWDFVKKETQE